MNETDALARFITSLDYDCLPRDVVEVAKDRILDQFGAQLIGSIQDWGKLIYGFAMDLGGKQESTILNYGGKATVLDTAFVNGCFGHGFEIDDTFRGAGHLGCTLVPPAFALAERQHSSGKELIAAVVAGYEAGGRVGRGADNSWARRGFHGTSIWGHFCAAAAAGKVLGLDAIRMRNALSITAGDSGGLLQFIRSGDVAVKRLYGGKPAYGGLRAALLAHRGMCGPADALEGESGVLHAFADQPNPANVTHEFGKDWVVLKTAYKHHCCGSLMQGMADLAISLRNKHHIKPEVIQAIDVGTLAIGSYIGGAITEPNTVGDAQFSSAFIVALAVVKGNCGYADFSDENLRDPSIRAVAKKVKVALDPELERLGPAGLQPARLTITLKDGTVLEESLADYIGTPSNPMSRRQVQDKFRDLAVPVLPKHKVEKVVAMVEGLESVWDVALMAPLLIR